MTANLHAPEGQQLVKTWVAGIDGGWRWLGAGAQGCMGAPRCGPGRGPGKPENVCPDSQPPATVVEVASLLPPPDRRLANGWADVVLENFRPGVMEGWGLGPEDLRPGLVFTRISGYGQVRGRLIDQ
jgi:hypothetical protein